MRIVDAHHHLWDLSVCRYPWLEARGVRRFFGDPTPIQKNYVVADLLADAGDIELAASVHIQVGTQPEDALLETEWLQRTAAKDGLPSAIVAYCELERDDVGEQLDAHLCSANLRGVRQIVGRSAEEDARTGSNALLDSPAWRRGLAAVRDRGLSFDLQLTPGIAARCADLFAGLPGLRVALCHCGSPWDQSGTGISSWKAGLERLASVPDIHCKISGLGMFDHDWTTDSIRPIVETCLDLFGAERCMFGSNFPVDKLHATYDVVWQAFADIVADLDAETRSGLFAENAANFYRISLPEHRAC